MDPFFDRFYYGRPSLLEGVGLFLLGAVIAAHKLVNAFRNAHRNEASHG